MVNDIVSLETAKRLKELGFVNPTNHYYFDYELPCCPKGLKQMKDGKTSNHNEYEDEVYSAPTNQEAYDWMLAFKIVHIS